MNVRYRVELSQTERAELTALLSGGKQATRKLKRAQVLLAADGGASDEEIARSVRVGRSTVYRTKRRFVLGSFKRCSKRASGVVVNLENGKIIGRFSGFAGQMGQVFEVRAGARGVEEFGASPADRRSRHPV